MTSIPDTEHAAHALAELAVRSHAVITAHQHVNGAYPASPTFSAYEGYAWLRDGGFIAEGISRFGDVDSADHFHDWVDGVLHARRGRVDELVAAQQRGEQPPTEAMLPTRFTLSGDDGPDDWWDFQTDGYGIWLWSVTTHARRHGIDPGRWQAGIDVAVDYLVAFWERPCYDWWEEHVEHRHVSTLGSIYGGLRAALEADVLSPPRAAAASTVCAAIKHLVHSEGVLDGHLIKWLGNPAVDGSLPSCIVPFGLIGTDDPIAVETLAVIQRELDSGGGVHRFRADVFYGGGQWLLLSAFLGWNVAASGDPDAARRYLAWIAAQATADGEMPEQVPQVLLHPEHQQEWIDRWGPVATPLLWSHGMYLILADELGLLDGVTP